MERVVGVCSVYESSFSLPLERTYGDRLKIKGQQRRGYCFSVDNVFFIVTLLLCLFVTLIRIYYLIW